MPPNTWRVRTPTHRPHAHPSRVLRPDPADAVRGGTVHLAPKPFSQQNLVAPRLLPGSVHGSATSTARPKRAKRPLRLRLARPRVDRVDHVGELLVHDVALDLEGRGQLAVLLR